MKTQAALTPIKSIRAKCIDCSGGYVKEVRLCPVTKCPLHPYRMGKRPKRHNPLSAEESDENVEITYPFLSNRSTLDGGVK